MLEGMAAIVAQPSEYRDAFSHAVDRRHGRADAAARPAWQTAATRAIAAISARLTALRPALAPRLKRNPGMTS